MKNFLQIYFLKNHAKHPDLAKIISFRNRQLRQDFMAMLKDKHKKSWWYSLRKAADKIHQRRNEER